MKAAGDYNLWYLQPLLSYNLTCCLGYIMDHDNGLTYNLTCCLCYIMDHHNGLTYNLSYCLGYIMDHDKVLPTI